MDIFLLSDTPTEVTEESKSIEASLVSILPGICPQLRTRIFHFVLS